MTFRDGLLICGLMTLALPAGAEDKPGRKTTVIQPGAKAPDAPAPVAAPAGGDREDFDLSSPEAPAKFVNRFFALLQKGDVDGAYDGLIRGSKIAERPEESKALRAKTREAIQSFGSVLGFQLIESKNVGEHLLRRTYLSVGKEFPLRWRFYFYKPDMAWRLVDLRVDDRLSGMFEEFDDTRSSPAKP